MTISRAADRQRRPSAGARPAGLPGEAGRGREAALLALSALVVVPAMVLTWLAVSRPLPEVEARLARGEIVNLNTASGAGDLLPLLAFLPSPQERSFVAERIHRRLAMSPVGNVGELGRIRVPAAEVAAHRLPALAARLAASGRDPRQSVALLSSAELRQLKPRLVVRTAAAYRTSYFLAAAVLLASFAAVHLVLRQRRFQGDEILLPVLLLFCGLGFVMMASLRDPLRDLPLHARFAQGVLGGCALFLLGALLDLERWALRLAAHGSCPAMSSGKGLVGDAPVQVWISIPNQPIGRWNCDKPGYALHVRLYLALFLDDRRKNSVFWRSVPVVVVTYIL